MGFWQWISPLLLQTAVITAIIFVLLVIFEFLAIRFTSFIEQKISGRRWVQYIISSLAGSIPGCTGVFAIDAAYMAGFVGFGGIISATVATFGDEAFVLIGQAALPDSPIKWQMLAVVFVILFVLGVIAGRLADLFAKKTKMVFCQKCLIEKHEYIDTTSTRKIPVKHFLSEHIWGHIIKKHIPNIVLWIFVSLVIVKALNQSFDMETIITRNKFVLVLAAAIIGILPLSGPNLIFITLFAQGQLPFSIFLTNSIVQDGHGLLPILGFSVEDAVKIKAFNLLFGLLVGYIFAAFGI
ncbi:arsenic efflux protein [bacterium]|nr:arsenic efflux protein [bacterium]